MVKYVSNTRIPGTPQFCYSNRLDSETAIQILQQFSEKKTIHEWKKWGNPQQAFCPFESLRGYKSNPGTFPQDYDLSLVWLKEHYPKFCSFGIDVRWMPTYSVESSFLNPNDTAQMVFGEDLQTEWKLAPVFVPKRIGGSCTDHNLMIWDKEYRKWLFFKIFPRIDEKSTETHLAFIKLLESWVDW